MEDDAKTNDQDDEVYELDDEEGTVTKENPSSRTDGSSTTQAEIDELKRQNLYLRADFDNFRKQTLKERSELIKFGSEPIIREFLSVLDNLERAAVTELTPETMTNYKNGIEMIVSQFKKGLEKFGVEEVDSLGQTFDPSMHEALTSESNPEFPDGSVSQVFKKAYKLNGKVIRPAQVVVNTGQKAD